jgi:flagellar protein FliT
MRLSAVPCLDYSGAAGMMHLRQLQAELMQALNREDWAMVRRLDRQGVVLVESVMAANKEDAGALIAALTELKYVYACLIRQCNERLAVFS